MGNLETTGAGPVLAFERLHIAARVKNDHGQWFHLCRAPRFKRLSDDGARTAQR